MDTGATLVWELVHWASLIVGTLAAFRYFRDLGDITQLVFGVSRKNVIFAIRHERAMIAIGLIGTIIAGLTFVYQGAGIKPVLVTLVIANVFFIAFPWTWLHIGLRNQQNTAKFYSIEEARDWVRPDENVIVLENKGEARAHPDYHIKRPHLAGTPEGLGGENIILTYCCMTHLGHGFKPEIVGKALDLEVLAQHGNNLIMKDMTTGEPVQQIYGTRECDGRFSEKKMQDWPTFRMPFRAFAKAYPNGAVFLNKYPKITRNPFLWLFDHLVEIIFLGGTVPHDRTENLAFDTMDVDDDRLRRKEYVWGFNIGKDSAGLPPTGADADGPS